jgi:putative selenium metabolism protein SsnA
MIVTNGIIVTWEEPNRILNDHAILIEDGIISAIEPQQELLDTNPEQDYLDAGGQYIFPGNICAHTHFYGAFARGMAIPGSPPKDFPEILNKLWWPLDKSLTHEDIHTSALVMLVDAIRNGTTTLIDHHASPNAVQGSLDVITEAIDESGLRGVLCYEVTDRDGVDKSKAGIEENVRFIERVNRENIAGGRVGATFGLHASLTLSEATLDACRQAAPAETGFHIHVAEHEADEYDSIAKSGMRVVDRLHQHQILGPRSIVAHAIHVDAREVDLLAQSGTWVTHQPRSNMNNGVGVSEVESMMRAGVGVCLGTDGFPHEMWEEWKMTYLLQKIWHRDPRRMSAVDVAIMAVYNNASLANQFLSGPPIGVIRPGASADLIFVDYHPHTPVTVDNLPWHIVFGIQERMVTTTIVDGRVLMQDRLMLSLDEEAITAHARELAPGVWERYEDFAREG